MTLVIMGGTAALAKSVVVQAGAMLTINALGSLAIDGSVGYGLNNAGTVDNSGMIKVGKSLVLVWKVCSMQVAARLTIKPRASVQIDRTSSSGDQAFYTAGIVNNEGTIAIGSMAAVAKIGLKVGGGTFNNKPGGSVQIDGTGSHALQVLNSGTVLNNEDLIEIGSNSGISGTGIRNENGSTLNNKVGGTIRINRVGIYNTNVLGGIRNSGVFNNDANITIGDGVLLYAQDGIFNLGSGNFRNNAEGVISIQKPWGNGIWNSSGTFQNAGKITISNIFYFEDGNFSTGILSTAPFTNSSGAEIHLDQVANGIASTNAFTNAGLIRMGENGPLTGSGIANIQGANAVFNNNAGGDISIKQTAVDSLQNDVNSTFNNNACATLSIFDNLNNSGAFTNAGLFTVNTTQVHTNSALTNNGIIAYPLGNPIPNVTNNEIIIAPVTANDCGPVSSAFGLGSPVDFTILGIFSDQAATMSAGTYVTATNTFTPSPVLAIGTYTLYVKIEDANGGCTRVLPWELTVEDNTAPEFDCTTLLDITANTDAGQCYATLNVTAPQAIDNCSGTITATGVRDDNAALTATYPVGTTTITWTFTDGANNEKQCTQKVVVSDATNPTASCKAPFSITLDGDGKYTLTVAEVDNNSSDNCGIVEYILSKINFTCADIGKQMVTLTVKDAAGLSDECSLEVTVQGSNTCSTSISNAGGPTISDPCTCSSVPLHFDEEVVITGNSNTEIWVLASNIGLIDPNTGLAFPTGTVFASIGNNQYALVGRHKSGDGYNLTATSTLYPGTVLAIGNTCYFPDVSINNVPALVSSSAAPFTVTGVAANSAVGTGTLTLNPSTPSQRQQVGASPTSLTINPAVLPLGINTLTYSFDAGVAGSKELSDPGCVSTIQKTFRVANCACQDVTVTLDANCQFRLTASLISDGNCAGGTVRVMDNSPGNGDLIDCAGVWTYGLFDAFGNIICWGKVTAEDKTAPALVCAPAPITLDCYDVNYVMNNKLTIGNVGATPSTLHVLLPLQRMAAPSPMLKVLLNEETTLRLRFDSSSLVSDKIRNLGYAYYRDNCFNCGCRVTLKWTDKVVFYACTDIEFTRDGYYAKIEREWVATDCNGMRADAYIQDIYFKRPALDLSFDSAIDDDSAEP
nr:HYR domain-containing protein [Haliscomenobacter sp.]